MAFAYSRDIGVFSYQELTRWVQQDLGFHDMRVGSAYRPNSVTPSGNVSLHARGNAVDWVGSPGRMIELAATLETFHMYILELEHSAGARPGRPDGYWVKNGDIVGPDRYGAVNVKDHYDHVHSALTLSGIAAAREQGPTGTRIASTATDTAGGCALPATALVGTAILGLDLICKAIFN